MRKLGHLAATAYGMVVLAGAALFLGSATVALLWVGWHQSHTETLILLGIVAVIALTVAAFRD